MWSCLCACDCRVSAEFAATKERRNLALFDFDGTITKRDAYGVFVAKAVPRWRLSLALFFTWPLIIAYRYGWLSGVRGRAIVAWVGFYRARCVTVEAVARHVATVDIPALVRPEIWAKLRDHLAQGDQVAVVSGSFDLYLRPWCEAHGLHLFCSSLERSGGRFTGRYAGFQCVGAEKVRRVREHFDLAQFAEIYAYGDTPDDRELLALAHRKFHLGIEITDLASV